MDQTCDRDYVATPTTEIEVSQKKAPITAEDVTDEGIVGGSGNDRKNEIGTILMPSETRYLTSLIDQPVNNHVPMTPLQQQAPPSVAPQVQQTPVSEPKRNTPPNLILLPPEIKLMIISYVKDERVWNMMKDRGPTIFVPSLRCLRMVHGSYRSLIPPQTIEVESPYDRADMLLMTEDYYPSIIAKDRFPCYLCLGVFDIAEFDSIQTHGAKAIGEEEAYHRLCKACWTKHFINKEKICGPKRIQIIMRRKREERNYGKHLLARFGSREVREAKWQRQKEEHAAECGLKEISSWGFRQCPGLFTIRVFIMQD